MSKSKIIIDPQPRTMDLIFDAKARSKLSELADLTVFDSGPMPAEMLEKVLPEAEIIIGQSDLSRERLEAIFFQTSTTTIVSRAAFAYL
jgi:hypothetical protein